MTMLTMLLLAGLYALGAVLMARRFHILAELELSDEPGPARTRPGVPVALLVLWPAVVMVLMCADAWVALTPHRRP